MLSVWIHLLPKRTRENCESNLQYSPTLQTDMVRVDRRSVSYPMWRKKVDRTILNDNGCTVLPSWVVDNFGIRDKFGVGKNKEENQIPIFFNKKRYDGGSITVQTESRATPFYRLWLPLELVEELRISFQMTYIRGLEEELQKKSSNQTSPSCPNTQRF